jgi:hypothetical protein
MNERIRELAEQARLWAEVSYKKQNDQFTSHWDTPIGYTVSQFFEQKFAEMIVQECVTIIKHGIDHTEYPHPNDVEKSMVEMKAQMWCRDAIKEYFGVK